MRVAKSVGIFLLASLPLIGWLVSKGPATDFLAVAASVPLLLLFGIFAILRRKATKVFAAAFVLCGALMALMIIDGRAADAALDRAVASFPVSGECGPTYERLVAPNSEWELIPEQHALLRVHGRVGADRFLTYRARNGAGELRHGGYGAPEFARRFICLR